MSSELRTFDDSTPRGMSSTRAGGEQRQSGAIVSHRRSPWWPDAPICGCRTANFRTAQVAAAIRKCAGLWGPHSGEFAGLRSHKLVGVGHVDTTDTRRFYDTHCVQVRAWSCQGAMGDDSVLCPGSISVCACCTSGATAALTVRQHTASWARGWYTSHAVDRVRHV